MNNEIKIKKILLDYPFIIQQLGKNLYTKIDEVLQAEIENVTEQDCINYMLELVINRTFDGYVTGISTIYGQLEKILDVQIEPAPDEWDRLFNVDFYILINEKYIGLQIKPINTDIQLPEIFKEKAIQIKSHEKFPAKYGGKVFYIYSVKRDSKKDIVNIEVISDIQQEIQRLQYS